MATKQRTYAEEAQRIIKKFKPRVDAGDSMAKEALNKHLASLKQQQEADKTAMQQKEQAKIMKKLGGKLPMMSFGGGLVVSDPMDYSGFMNENKLGLAKMAGNDPLSSSFIPVASDPTGNLVKFYADSPFIDNASFNITPSSYKGMPNIMSAVPSWMEGTGIDLSTSPNGDPFSGSYGYNSNVNSRISSAAKDTMPGKSGLSPYQWGTLGANLAGSIGQLGPLIGASKVKMPSAQPVNVPAYTPESDTESRRAIERNYANIFNDPNMSELGRRAVVNKASVDMGNQIGRLSQDTMNANIKGKSEHDRLTTETGLQNERERISTETAKSQKKLDDYSAMSGWVGNLGKVVGSEFADAQKEDMQLVSIVAGSPVGRTMRKIGSSYYNIDKVGSGLSVVSPVIGGKGQKTRYFHNDDEIDEETYNTLEAADRKKGTVPHVAN